MKKIFFLLIGLLMITCSMASADGFKSISADDLKKMIDATKQIVLVDSRTVQEFALGHIPKAINISPENVNGIAALLPKDKAVLLVFYCRGVG